MGVKLKSSPPVGFLCQTPGGGSVSLLLPLRHGSGNLLQHLFHLLFPSAVPAAGAAETHGGVVRIRLLFTSSSSCCFDVTPLFYLQGLEPTDWRHPAEAGSLPEDVRRICEEL